MLNYLTCGILSPFCLKSGFWAILKDFEWAYMSLFSLGQGEGAATRRLTLPVTVPNNRTTREEPLFWKGSNAGVIFPPKTASLLFQAKRSKDSRFSSYLLIKNPSKRSGASPQRKLKSLGFLTVKMCGKIHTCQPETVPLIAYASWPLKNRGILIFFEG